MKFTTALLVSVAGIATLVSAQDAIPGGVDPGQLADADSTVQGVVQGLEGQIAGSAPNVPLRRADELPLDLPAGLPVNADMLKDGLKLPAGVPAIPKRSNKRALGGASAPAVPGNAPATPDMIEKTAQIKQIFASTCQQQQTIKAQLQQLVQGESSAISMEGSPAPALPKDGLSAMAIQLDQQMAEICAKAQDLSKQM